jgi:hypothetical protein
MKPGYKQATSFAGRPGKSNYTIDLYNIQEHLGTNKILVINRRPEVSCTTDCVYFITIQKDILFKAVLFFYKISRIFKLDWLLKAAILPPQYKTEIKH